MARISRLILVLLSFFFLASCTKSDLSELAKEGNWIVVYETSSSMIEKKGIENESLYYNALSLYYTARYKEAVDASRLYCLMYDSTNPVILKILLYKASYEEAYEAGKALLAGKNMNSSDKIQYFSILNSLERVDEANAFIKELKAILTPYEYCFALINGKATSSTILEGMEMLYESDGISNNFLAIADKAYTIFANREYRSKPESFLEKTFDGNSQYALIAGDFFYRLNDNAKALEYWEKAKKMYPNAYQTRVESL